MYLQLLIILNLIQRYEGEFWSGLKHGRGKYTWSNGEEYKGQYKNDKKHGKGIHKFVNGDVYEGEFKEGKKSGKGIIKFSNGDIFEGLFENDSKAQQGVYRFANGNVYDGEWQDDKRHGFGTHTFANGNSFTGTFFEGAKHGKGVYQYANGDTYDGDYDMDKKHGKGIYKFSSGAVYDGDWSNDKRHGLGIFNLSTGDRYEGGFLDGMMHGIGTFRSANGDLFEGEYVEDKIQGLGKYTWSDGSSYEGLLVDGKKEGVGKQIFSSGDVYEGDFRNDMMNGNGVYKFSNGDCYEGMVKDDQLYGHGKFIFANGQVYEGMYKSNDGANGMSDRVNAANKHSHRFSTKLSPFHSIESTKQHEVTENDEQEVGTDDHHFELPRASVVGNHHVFTGAMDAVDAEESKSQKMTTINIPKNVVTSSINDVEFDEIDTEETSHISPARMSLIARKVGNDVDMLMNELSKRTLSTTIEEDGDYDNTPIIPDANPTIIAPIAKKLPPAIVKGYINKSGGKYFTTWHSRFFVLLSSEYASTLTYFVAPTEVPPYGTDEKGRLNMRGQKLEVRGEYLLLSATSEAELHKDRVFKMHIKDKVNRQTWIDAFHEHIDYADNL